MPELKRASRVSGRRVPEERFNKVSECRRMFVEAHSIQKKASRIRFLQGAVSRKYFLEYYLSWKTVSFGINWLPEDFGEKTGSSCSLIQRGRNAL
jgi:hypothetical protein